ncbi:Succinyl-CoA:3-ketoacid-coenzyme A transferase [Nesidiocoris tenuis]|uniref:Golgi SNAP receptor complex member 1 n=1 Tax=Nesidiocoris tenuis TaxID=355587 RepID=A0ABN7BF46_9HEMI|nr:Succinyl-CoA:3-ketoacid-coenzyme A transferase [Nesidiocoris tenuis]
MAEYSDVNRRSRVLEGELDLKLATFNKMCVEQSRRTVTPISVHRPNNYSDQMIESTRLEIDSLIGQLRELNEQLLSIIGDESPTPIRHAVIRQTELIRDYVNEYGKICENYRASKEREELLASRKQPPGRDRSADRENLLLHSSDSMVDAQLKIAMDTKSQLLSQRKRVKSVHTRLRNIYHKFPAINDLMGRIAAAKRRRLLATVVFLGVLGVIVLPKYILRGYF